MKFHVWVMMNTGLEARCIVRSMTTSIIDEVLINWTTGAGFWSACFLLIAYKWKRYRFVLVLENLNGKGEAEVGNKDLKVIQREIRDVMLQICSTITFLPFLDCLCKLTTKKYRNIETAIGKLKPFSCAGTQFAVVFVGTPLSRYVQ